MTIKIKLACGYYDRTDALRDGRVTASGIELEYLVLPVEELIWRMLGHREFDVAETSLGSYIVRRDRGVDDLVAIPVFTSRSFRHAALVVRASTLGTDSFRETWLPTGMGLKPLREPASLPSVDSVK